MKQREPQLTKEEFEVLSEQAWARVAELGYTQEQTDLLMWISTRNGAGKSPEGWDEIKGTVFVATASRERIDRWLDEASERRWPDTGPCASDSYRNARDLKEMRAERGL